MIEILGYRDFSHQDQLNFASLSGDYNPIHIDPIAARRTIAGQRLVHGMHALLWALESLTEHHKQTAKVIKAEFIKPIFLNDVICCEWNSTKSQILLKVEDTILVKIKLTTGLANLAQHSRMMDEITIPRCHVISFFDCGPTERLSLTGHGDPQLAHRLFPACVSKYGLATVYEIAASSYVVGMEFPGQNSLFASFSATLNEQKIEPFFLVSHIDERFRLIQLLIEGQAISARAEAFYRPIPTQNATIEIVAEHVKNGAFSRVRALIIGGSRGIGEIVAKIICVGGGTSTITYNVGKGDAEAVVAEISAWGGNCQSMHLDISTGDALSFDYSQFNQIYYFASPKILPNRNQSFDYEQTEVYKKVFVEAFEFLCLMVMLQKLNISIFYPSTIFIDRPVSNFDNYIAAKLAGEAICKETNLSSGSVKVIFSRLPRLNTDQNQSLQSEFFENVVDVMLPVVQKMSAVLL